MGIDRSDAGAFKINRGANLGETDMFTLTTSGNLGIGTTGPGQKLDINGQVRIRGGSPAAGEVLKSSDSDGNASWEPESDPQVGTVTNSKLCRGDGSAVQCDTGISGLIVTRFIQSDCGEGTRAYPSGYTQVSSWHVGFPGAKCGYHQYADDAGIREDGWVGLCVKD